MTADLNHARALIEQAEHELGKLPSLPAVSSKDLRDVLVPLLLGVRSLSDAIRKLENDSDA
jgi:hypothetical protein